jgi:hypothetical protein
VPEDAVGCEPVSAPNSLLTGKLTGNLPISGVSAANLTTSLRACARPDRATWAACRRRRGDRVVFFAAIAHSRYWHLASFTAMHKISTRWEVLRTWIGPRPRSPPRLMPSRPGEFHPEPLTEPDLTLRLVPPREGCRLPLNIGFLPLPVDPRQMAMTRSLRSTALTRYRAGDSQVSPA